MEEECYPGSHGDSGLIAIYKSLRHGTRSVMTLNERYSGEYLVTDRGSRGHVIDIKVRSNGEIIHFRLPS